MDDPLRLILRARASHAKLADYTCTVVKREVVDGKLAPQAVIAMKVRLAPYSVALKWAEPSDLKGQEAYYITGKNDGKMRVRPAGLLAAVGFVSLSPDDPRARATSKHSITEAGIGHVIERFVAGWEAEKKLGLTQVKLGNFEFSKRRCIRVETLHTSNPDKVFLYHRSAVYFDHEHHLPVRVECYAWPQKAGDPGELAEVYSFYNLRTNNGLKDDAFGM